MDIPTNKKRKLNSKNPKYLKVETIKVRKEFVAEVRGVKISKIYNI
jgi:hypothetical protein